MYSVMIGVGNNYFSWVGRLAQTAAGTVKSFFATKSNKSSAHEINRLHDDPKLGEKCGVFGVFNLGREPSENLGFSIYEGLNKLQGRGQDACGLAFAAGKLITRFPDPKLKKDPEKKDYGIGLVSEILGDEDKLNLTGGSHGIGHTLYATSRAAGQIKPQPIIVGENGNKIALAHNGNIPDTSELKSFLKERTSINTDTLSDSGMIAHVIHYFYKKNISEAKDQALQESIKEASKYFGKKGSYSLLIMDHKKLAILRDPYGIRPLSLAKKGDQVYVASETAAFTPLRAKFIRDIQPGELLVISKKTIEDDLEAKKAQIIFDKNETQNKLCAIEPIYLMRPDSVLNDKSVSELRRNCGIQLAEEFKARYPKEAQEIDYVIPVLESGLPAATGFAEGIIKPINPALIKNFHRRTFIDVGNNGQDINPKSEIEKARQKVESKFTLIDDAVKNKVIALVDDSIVRGATMGALVEFVKKAKPKAVHLLSASPPILYPNFYGIDTPKQQDLIAAESNNNWTKIAATLGSKTVTYLSINGFLKAMGRKKDELELSKFTGEYPIDIGQQAKLITKQPKPIYEIPTKAAA